MLLLLLASCSVKPDRETRAERRVQRETAASAHIAQPPTQREHEMAHGSLVVVEVPVTDGYGGLDRQQCFVWRDAQFKTANITCPARETFVGNN
jgi:hypothetical protein